MGAMPSHTRFRRARGFDQAFTNYLVLSQLASYSLCVCVDIQSQITIQQSVTMFVILVIQLVYHGHVFVFSFRVSWPAAAFTKPVCICVYAHTPGALPYIALVADSEKRPSCYSPSRKTRADDFL